MLVWKGIVTRKDIETYTDPKDKKEKEAIRFSIENASLVPDRGLAFDDLPDVGTPVEAMVNRIYLSEKKRDMWVFLGLVQPQPALAVAPHSNGSSAPAAVAA